MQHLSINRQYVLKVKFHIERVFVTSKQANFELTNFISNLLKILKNVLIKKYQILQWTFSLLFRNQIIGYKPIAKNLTFLKFSDAITSTA